MNLAVSIIFPSEGRRGSNSGESAIAAARRANEKRARRERRIIKKKKKKKDETEDETEESLRESLSYHEHLKSCGRFTSARLSGSRSPMLAFSSQPARSSNKFPPVSHSRCFLPARDHP